MRTMSRRDALRSLSVASFVLPLSAMETTAQGAVRPVAWARPIALAGVPNLHAMAQNIYRSAQPRAEGFIALATRYGVKTVISMRANHEDDDLVEGLDMRALRFPTDTWHIRRASVVGALRTLRQTAQTEPVLLHCQHGADRTGLVAALYRIMYENWSKDAALDEMINGGFGYHAIWGNIPRFIERFDVERLRREVGEL